MTDEEKMKEYARAFASKGGRARAKALSPDELSEIGRKGAQGRKNALTPEQRSEIARRAVEARWAKKRAGDKNKG